MLPQTELTVHNMEVKKSEKALLKNKRFLFAEIGLIAALVVVWAAFQITSKPKIESFLGDGSSMTDPEDIVPITLPDSPPPPVEAPKLPVLSTNIDIVDNDIKLEDTFYISPDDDISVVIPGGYIEDIKEETIEEEAIPVVLVEKKPTFQGGDANTFAKWVNRRLVYPEIAKDNGVEGRVMLKFTVNADGSVSDVTVLRGADPALDKEAVRVVSSSPKWEPGMQRDRRVKVTFTFPVIFKLQ